MCSGEQLKGGSPPLAPASLEPAVLAGSSAAPPAGVSPPQRPHVFCNADEAEQRFTRSFPLSGDSGGNGVEPSRTLFFPVRHHSPACAFHLTKTFERFKPDCVLIEGPADANHLIGAIADQSSVPPFAIYCGFNDAEGLVSAEKEKYRAYYPFLSFSPEYAAIISATASGVPVRFIDLPYASLLIASSQSRAEEARHTPEQGGAAPVPGRQWHDEALYEDNSYTAALARKAGFRSYAEFWEAFYEIPAAGMETETFVRSLFHLGLYMRMADNEDSGTKSEITENKLRETFMMEQIVIAQKEYRRILVIAGAYHVPALAQGEDLAYAKSFRSFASQNSRQAPRLNASVWLMPYTFAEMDGRKGYAAGMHFPAYYGEVWNKLAKGSGGIWQEAARDFIVRTARFARNTTPVSIPDEVNALASAVSLASLRGKNAPGVYELIDGVQSAFVKGDINRTVTSELDYLLRILSGIKAGAIAASKYQPPIVEDFRLRCAEFGVRLDTVLKQETTLDILKNPRHYQKSRFFHQLVFLETGFCRRLSGPDYVTGESKNVIREKWEYRYDSNVETALIDQSVFGATLAEAAAHIALRRFRDNVTAEEMGKLFIVAELMGLDDFSAVCGNEAEEVIDREGFFTSAASCLESLNYLAHLREMLHAAAAGAGRSGLDHLVERCFYRTVELMDQGKNSGPDEEQRACRALMFLHSLTIGEEAPSLRLGAYRQESGAFRQIFADKVEAIIDGGTCNSRFYGTLLALHEKHGRIDSGEFARRVQAWLDSSLADIDANRGGADDAASFIAGVILAGRDILFTEPGVLAAIDRVVFALDDETFLSVLPQFRRAFTAFLPAETGRLGQMAAALHGLSGDDGGLHPEQVTREELTLGMALDKKTQAAMDYWGIGALV